uniref:Death-associated protein n=1 Tax=Sinocyclocheilus anshuiensis TaxID=1608454 RepID=A0A671RV18_9TELE
KILNKGEKNTFPEKVHVLKGIVQKHQSANDAPEKNDKDSKEYETEIPPKLPVVVSGVVTKGDKDFTPAAAQVAHQKPVPAVQKLPPSHHINQHIHQPRK